MNAFSQKVAVITGASQGVGAGLVEGYRKLGYAVVATSRGIDPSQDPDLATVRGDISDPETAEGVVAVALERFGHIDTLVNNAGVFVAKPFTDDTQQGFNWVTGVALGIIKTPMRPAEYHETLAAMHPLGRMGQVSDVVDAALYLERASFVTGAVVHVDGGQSAGR
jgi:NAD(P)-dependent dehydrogenase (short-subunit alcohol dehydrogenase family)